MRMLGFSLLHSNPTILVLIPLQSAETKARLKHSCIRFSPVSPLLAVFQGQKRRVPLSNERIRMSKASLAARIAVTLYGFALSRVELSFAS